jgi:cytochrome c-type biogenesis protein CcmH
MKRLLEQVLSVLSLLTVLNVLGLRRAGVGRAIGVVPVLAVLLVAHAAIAVDIQERFDDPVLEQRYQTLIHEVRCLVCLNQTIADSTVPLAAELRRTVHELVADGKSEQEVSEYLVARYGDFVMYKPPLRPDTWLLWGAPVILLAIGAVIFARILKHRSSQPLDDDSGQPLDEGPMA